MWHSTILLVSTLIAQVAPANLLRSAMDPNPTLLSYVATAAIEVRLRAPIPISRHFQGTASYLRPKGTVTFDRLPRALAALNTLTTTSPTFDEATVLNTITVGSDDGAHAVYLLAPKDSASRVSSLTLTVGDTDGLI